MRLKSLIALLVLATIATTVMVGGVFAGAGPAANASERTSQVPRLATESPFTLNVEEARGPHLILKIEGIKNESVIWSDVTRLYGSTLPDALVTVNGSVVAVTTHGLFYTDVKLDPGANFIEVVASDFSGREAAASFTVVSIQ